MNRSEKPALPRPPAGFAFAVGRTQRGKGVLGRRNQRTGEMTPLVRPSSRAGHLAAMDALNLRKQDEKQAKRRVRR